MNLEQELKEIVAKVMKLPKEKVTLEADFFKELGIDSLMAVEILSAVDRKYGIDIPEEKAKEMKNLKSLIQIVASCRAS